MKKLYLLLFLLPTLLIGQNITIAEDDADNYDPSAWDTNNNQGTGFGAWAFDTATPNDGAAGRFIGSFSTALDVNSKSFGLFANSGNDATSGATRPFLKSLEDGDTFTVSVGVNFRDGNKGFDLRDSNDNTIINFNVGGDAYNLTGTLDLFGNAFDANTVFTFTFTQNANDVSWTVDRTGGLTATQSGTISGINSGTINDIRFYNVSAGTNNDGGAGQRNLYFNSLEMTSPFVMPPTTNASNLQYENIGRTTMEISWTNGNGANRIVVLKAGSAVDAAPVNGTAYTANTVFGNGDQIGTGNYVVYNGNDNPGSVTVTGLTAGTTYHVEVFEYDGATTEESYRKPGLTGSQATTTDYLTVPVSSGGDWNTASHWLDGVVPPLGASVVIRVNTSLDVSPNISAITINSGGFVSAGTGNRTITITDGGTFTNNGTFSAGNSTVSFTGSGTISGTTTFNNVDIAGGVNFGTASTIGGTLTINAGGFADTNGPTYGGSSTLEFATGGQYNISTGNLLWGTGNTVGQSVPNNVLVSSTTPLNIFEARDVTGNLIINSGASVVQGNNAFIVQGNFENSGTYSFVIDGKSPLTVQGNFVNNSGADFSLSTDTAGGGDLEVKGNFTDNGDFTSNNRAVFFTGASDQTINATSTVTIDFIIIDTENGDNVIMNQNLNLPNNLTLTSGNLVLNGNILTISGDIRPNNGPGTIIASDTGSTLEFTNTAARTIENADIQNNEVANLTFSGTGGVTINTDLNVTERFFSAAGDNVVSSTSTLSIPRFVAEGETLAFIADIDGNSSLTFKSDANGTALFQINDFESDGPEVDGFLFGKFITERYMSANRAFRFIVPTAFYFPGAPPTSINANWQEGATSANYDPNPGFGTHITGAQGTAGQVTANGLDETFSGNPSLFTYNSETDNYNAILNTNAPFVPLLPYAIFVRGDRSIDLTDDTAEGPETVLRTRGINLYVGDADVDFGTFSLSDNAGKYNLVPNVYQSIVDACKIQRTNINPTMWARSITDGNGQTGSWLTIDLDDVDGLCSGNPVPAPSSSNSQYIPPGVAVFFQTTATVTEGTTNLAFDADPNSANYVINNDPPDQLTTVYSPTSTFYINSRLYTSSELQNGDVERDAIGLRFGDQYSLQATNQEDAVKFMNDNENLGIDNNGLRAIDKQPMPTIGHIIPLHTSGYTATNYSLLFMMANMPSGLGVFINDAYLGTQTELTDGFVYDFTVDASIPESIAEDRFSLVFDNTTLSTTDNVFGNNFSLYPNPAPNGRFYVTTPGLSGTAQVTLTNVLGQQVYARQLDIQNQEVQIHADNLSSGVYMMNLTQGEQSFSTKVIIE
jgi:hypothetical protein